MLTLGKSRVPREQTAGDWDSQHTSSLREQLPASRLTCESSGKILAAELPVHEKNRARKISPEIAEVSLFGG